MRISPLLTTAACTLLLAACGGGSEEEPTTSTATSTASGASAVPIKAFQFMPDRLEVEAGTTVRWTNEDATVHTVTAGTRKAPERETFDGSMDQGESFEHTFAESGTYKYFCDRHNGPGMTSTVVVR